MSILDKITHAAEILKRTGQKSDLAKSILLTSGMYEAYSEARESCKEQGVNPGEFAAGMISILAVFAADHALGQAFNPRKTIDTYAMVFHEELKIIIDTYERQNGSVAN